MTQERTEKEPHFRKAIYIGMLALLLIYVALKSQHILLAIDAYQGQELSVSTHGAAK